MTSPQTRELERLERREAVLRVSTLCLLVVLLGTILVTALWPRAGARAPAIVLSLVLLVLGGYLAYSGATAARIRRLYRLQAVRDPLTGLLNRQAFSERMGAEIARADRAQSLLAFLLCDLDNFKQVNDNLGHAAGDRVLQEVATIMEQATRGSDLVFRWGGDEMLIVLSTTTRDGVMIAAERVRRGIQRIIIDPTVSLDLSLGVALYPEHGRDVDGLLQLADRALYIAKRGSGKVHIGEEQYPVSKEAVRLVFQPVVDGRTREIVGHEALSRDPRGEIDIEELFHRYRAVGQLGQLQDLIFELQLIEAKKLGLERLFVNVDMEMLERMTPRPRPQGLEVVLELSERDVLRQIERQITITGRWRDRGFKFAIDDFGSGFISLPFVAQLVPSYIKLNRETILEAVTSEAFCGFLRDMIVAMRNYSSEGVIAEGIETEEELEVASSLGAQLVQGYLTGRPTALG